MARTLNRLAKAAVTGAKFTGKPRKLFDGGGLFLHITSPGKYWRLKYRFAGREKLLALGVFPDVSLAQARAERDGARRLLAEGIDPGAQRQADKARGKADETGDTFAALAREWSAEVHARRACPRHARDCLHRFEKHVFPDVGHLPIRDVTAPQLLVALRRMERAGIVANANRVRALCSKVFRYGIATERCERDPAGDLREALATPTTRHHVAITDPDELASLLRAVECYDTGEPTTKALLRLTPLLFTRPGELRTARWEDFDLDAGTWDFQPSKGGAPMVTPLPRQALEVLRDLHRLTGPEGYVFPSIRGKDRPLSQNTLRHAFNVLGYHGKVTVHGFRATARTLIVERLDFPAEHVEMQLGHAVRDANGRAYNRTTFLEQRRKMLQSWADYLDKLRSGIVAVEAVA